jgi:pimeloyl-ACP methyl ester carboxylesterase
MIKTLLALALFTISLSALEAKTIVYLNGGPGLNSEPERHLLAPHLQKLNHETYFWDEPSELRLRNETYSQEKAFQQATESAENFIQKICEDKNNRGLNCQLTLMAHSFSVHHAVRLAEKYPKTITELILISPALNIKDADNNIFKVAVKGLLDEGHPDASAELAAMIPSLEEAFDQKKIQAFMLASQYASLFVNYWSDMNLMQQYFSFMQGEYSFDAKGMFAVRATMPKIAEFPSQRITIPTQVYFGELDPISLPEQQITALRKYFTTLDLHILAGAKHYSHLERLTNINY